MKWRCGRRLVAAGDPQSEASDASANGGAATASLNAFLSAVHPHFESPQFKQVLQPSIMTTAAVLHFAQSWAPSGKCDLEKASVCLVRASNSARFSWTSLR